MSARYQIGIFDCAGQYGGLVGCDYPDMARVVRAALAARYPQKTVVISDLERDGREMEDDDNG